MSDLESILERCNQRAIAAKAETDRLLATFPPKTACAIHGEIMLLDPERTAHSKSAVYAPCAKCSDEHVKAADAERLKRQGVPSNLLAADFDNWKPANEQDEALLNAVIGFATARRGFLLMLGEFGTGKTHLAVAVMRRFRSALMVKQSELLRRLRATYRDKAAIDPVDQAQGTPLLVLDEVGFSPGGRDELPMLHDILDHRHGNQMPTILTGNITLDRLKDAVGERMEDRLRESCFAILNFSGTSHRRESREKYFWQRDD
jgi:DNA replication protein DnaC